jgi:pSer/pThr/pTyr-binding forkhead associated (FHA) protein
MKVDLVVEHPRKMAGKTIPVTLPQFLIGRDPKCQIRPSSATVSKKHCAVLVLGDQAFIQDFNSTNGTFVNDERVEGERELRDGDRLRIAGIEFRVALNVAPVIAKPSGESVSPSPSAEEDAAAALLLSLDEGGAPGGANLDSEGIPTDSTVLLPPDAEKPERAEPERVVPPSGAAAREAAGKSAQGNTAAAAQDILKSYRRPHK